MNDKELRQKDNKIMLRFGATGEYSRLNGVDRVTNGGQNCGEQKFLKSVE